MNQKIRNMRNSTTEAVLDWKQRNGLKKRSQYSPLLEAFRRINMFKKGNVDSTMVLLEFPSSVKDVKEFVAPYSGEQKRCLNWYNLTDKGKELIKDLNLVWDEEMNNEIFIEL